MKKLILLLLSVCLCTTNTVCYSREVEEPRVTEENKDKWVEVQSIVLPFDLPVNSGVTTKGNPKYWFTFKEIGDVTISATNYKKYSTKSERIELVKWQKSSKYRYTTRAKEKANIDLTKLFKNNLEN